VAEEKKDALATISIETVHFVDRETEKSSTLTDTKIAALKELILARFDAEKEAGRLAYVELQRRLDVLNHNHEEMNKRNSFFLPRENFEQFFKDFGTWRDSVNATLSNQAGRMAAYAIGIVIIFGILNLVSHFWH
jgi:hypothetical protein